MLVLAAKREVPWSLVQGLKKVIGYYNILGCSEGIGSNYLMDPFPF